jgi:hypothetical protein
VPLRLVGSEMCIRDSITGPAEWQKRIATGEFKGIKVAAK